MSIDWWVAFVMIISYGLSRVPAAWQYAYSNISVYCMSTVLPAPAPALTHTQPITFACCSIEAAADWRGSKWAE